MSFVNLLGIVLSNGDKISETADKIEDGIKYLGAALNIFNKHGISEERIKQLLSKYRDEDGNVIAIPTPDEVDEVIDRNIAEMKARWGDE